MSILETDVLVFTRHASLTRDDYEITAEDGTVLGSVTNRGHVLSRMFLGNREFTIEDAAGNTVVSVADIVDIGFDTYEIAGPDGELATVRKRFAFTISAWVEVGDTKLELDGSLFSWEFEIRKSDELIASVSKSWTGIGNESFGVRSYAVRFSTSDTELRRVVLGTLVAIDCMRKKRNRPS